MYGRFINNIEAENLFSKEDKLLLGVSGGVDSMVLAHLINRHGNDFAIAHCNFNLRGEESDGDEAFVKEMAESYGVRLFSVSFDTTGFAEEMGISVEMAARKLRYDWFEKICIENGFDYIVVGHHLDDVLETFFLNLARGTGIRGLSGIKAKAGRIIRPLLFASRKEIEAYALENNIDFRFDSSNDDVIYKRNSVRHKVLPLMEELNPSFRVSLKNTITYLSHTEELFLKKIEELREMLVSNTEAGISIDKRKLDLQTPKSLILYELLRPYNFNNETVEEIINSSNNTGSKFYSSTHRLVVDRESYIITIPEKETLKLFYIEENQEHISDPIEMNITVEDNFNGYKIPKSKNTVVFDLMEVDFPIVIRKWQRGDYFKPFGMSGFKKLSDFFIDEKMSIPEKENCWIMLSGNRIMWVIGRRTDERFKISDDTKRILRIEISEGNG